MFLQLFAGPGLAMAGEKGETQLSKARPSGVQANSKKLQAKAFMRIRTRRL